jgi:nucleotide-binding universal stress UspA family protein
VEAAQKEFAGILAEIPGSVECKVAIQMGDPGDQIVAVAKTMQADLIVMATYGRKA